MEAFVSSHSLNAFAFIFFAGAISDSVCQFVLSVASYCSSFVRIILYLFLIGLTALMIFAALLLTQERTIRLYMVFAFVMGCGAVSVLFSVFCKKLSK